MSSTGSSSDDLLLEAEALYERVARLRGEGRAGGLDELCESRPDLADALRRVDEDYRRAEALIAPLREPESPDELSPASPSTASSAELLGRLRAPAAAGGFRSMGLIARGGMGEVHEVWDPRIRRTLAMKVLRPSRELRLPSIPDEHRLSRFVREAQIAGQLEHPGIVPVHELGVDESDRAYFTMPVIRGRSFAEIIDLVHRGEASWSRTRALGILVKICEAMAFAHAKRVIHRDLKPSNVMYGRYGETYVMDWGLAKVLGEPDPKDIRIRDGAGAEAGAEPRATLPDRPPGDEPASHPEPNLLVTMDGDVIGTPAYMSPEQAAGRIDEVDERSDAYAAGAVLYHLLTGSPPYSRSGESRAALDVLRDLLAGPPAAVHALRPDVPAELVAICERAMARDPGDRYGDMLAMARDLQAFLDDRVVAAYRTGAAAEFGKWVSRNRGMAAALAAGVLAAIGGLAGIAVVQSRGQAAVIRANRNLNASNESLRRSLYFNDIALAQSAREAFNTANMKSLLAGCEEDLRGWEWSYLNRVSDTSARTLVAPGGSVNCIAFSPDGAHLACGQRESTLRIWDVRSGTEVASLEGHADLIDEVEFSPDGRRVASCSRDHTVRLWNLRTRATDAVLLGHEDIVRSLAFTPDGQTLVTGSFDGTVRVWDVATGKCRRVLRGHEGGVHTVAASPAGDRLASGGFDGTVRLWNAATGAELRVLRGHSHWVRTVVFAPDGRTLLSGTNARNLELWDVYSGEMLGSFVGRTFTQAAAFSPDGSRIASDEYSAIRIWDVETREPIASLYGHDSLVNGLAFAPQGSLLASSSSDRTIKLWDLDRDPVKAELHGHTDIVEALDLAADSSRIATGGRDGTIRVWDVLRRVALLEVQAGQDWISAVVFSPDTRRLATGGSDGSLCLRSAATGEVLARVDAHEDWVRTLEFAPDGRSLVSASYDGTVRLWTSDGLRELARFGPFTAFHHAGFDPAGELVYAGGRDGVLRLWDVASGTPRLEVQAHGAAAGSESLSPDDSRKSTINAAAISPDGTRIATGGGDRLIRVWDVATGRQLFEASGHEHTVQALVFSHDGQRLFSTGYEGFLKVWDARTGRLALTLQGDDRALGASALACSSDGRFVTAAGVGRTVFLWDAGATSR